MTDFANSTVSPHNPGLKLKVAKLNDFATVKMPDPGDAGLDLSFAGDLPIWVEPGKNISIPTGLAVEIPEGFYGQILGRSSLAKKGLVPLGGVIDSSYRGEIIIVLQNLNRFPTEWFHDSDSFKVEPGDRVAQLVVLPILDFAGGGNIDVVDQSELSDTSRGDKGFGSTGV